MPGAPPRILVIEDDHSIMRMLRFALRTAGFEVTEAAGGTEGARVLTTQPPDAVVLDLGLADRQATEVLDRLRNVAPGTAPCPAWVVISAMEWEDVLRLYDVPPASFLPKPFDPWRLIGMLNQMLEERDAPLS